MLSRDEKNERYFWGADVPKPDMYHSIWPIGLLLD